MKNLFSRICRPVENVVSRMVCSQLKMKILGIYQERSVLFQVSVLSNNLFISKIYFSFKSLESVPYQVCVVQSTVQCVVLCSEATEASFLIQTRSVSAVESEGTLRTAGESTIQHPGGVGQHAAAGASQRGKFPRAIVD